jgi:hypothetical protein
MNSKMNKFLLTIFATIILTLSIFGQTPDFQTVKTEKGLMVLNRNPTQSFSFLVAGSNPKDRQNSDGSLSVATDDGGFELYFINVKDFLGTKKPTNEAEILQAHQDWDIAKEENAWTNKLKVATKLEVEKFANFVTIKNLQNQLFPTKTISTLSWSYTMPNSSDKYFNQTVLMGDLVVMFTVGYEKSVNVEIITSFFKQTLESITLLPPQKQTVTPKKKVTKDKVKKN